MSPACARPISIDGRPRQRLRAPSRRVSSAPLPRWPWVERPTRLALQARRVRPPRQVPLCADLPALLSCAQPPHDGPWPRAVPQPQQPPLGFSWPVLPVRASPAQHSQSCPAALPRPSVACDRSCARSCPQCPMAAGGPGPKPRSLPRGPRLIRPPWIEVVRRSTRRAIPIAGATGEAASCVPADMSARALRPLAVAHRPLRRRPRCPLSLGSRLRWQRTIVRRGHAGRHSSVTLTRRVHLLVDLLPALRAQGRVAVTV